MATANDVIERAFRWLGVLAGEEAMSAAEMVNALATFNDMLHGFGPGGIKYVHTTLAASDTVNFPDEQLANVRLLIAAELAPEYEVTLDAPRMAQIQRARSELQAAYWVTPQGLIDPLLTFHPAGRFNMSSG